MCIVFWCEGKARSASEQQQPQHDSTDEVAASTGWMQRYRFVLAANRDEDLYRPTAPAMWWSPEGGFTSARSTDDKDHEVGSSAPLSIVAGRDLKGGGTWLGIGSNGRLSVLTNVRIPNDRVRPDAHSRGQLLLSWLLDGSASPRDPTVPSAFVGDSARDFLKEVASRKAHFNPYNLLVGHLKPGARDNVVDFYGTGATPEAEVLTPTLDSGCIHAVTNGTLNEPWPKLERGKRLVHETVLNAANSTTEDELVQQLFVCLKDVQRPHRSQLPDTGCGIEHEELLSSVFIPRCTLKLATPSGEVPITYGTRSQAVILVSHSDEVCYVERSLLVDGSLPRLNRGRQDRALGTCRTWFETDDHGRWLVTEHRFVLPPSTT